MTRESRTGLTRGDTMTEAAPEATGEFVEVEFTETGARGTVPAAALPYWEAKGYKRVEESDGLTEEERLIQQGVEQVAASTTAQFDPSTASAKAVAEYLSGLDTATPQGQAEYDRVVAAEQAGQNRSTAIPSA
jgi:hypothetical protein